MELSNDRVAWVNRSSAYIPIYNSLVPSSGHTGGKTAGGTQIGKLYPDEFYTLVPNDSFYVTSWKIHFRNANGAQATGYIESLPEGETHDRASWYKYQEPYHYYNSNGSSLVTSASETINGISYRIFTVEGSARACIDSGGNTKASIAVGTKLAANSSTTGQSNGGYMVFQKKKIGTGAWQDCVSGGTSTYGFVDLGLSTGSMPSNRPIR